MNTNKQQLHFLGIGAPKCGTSKIASLLAAHPEICLSEPKEIQYFNERVSYAFPHLQSKYKDKDWNWYYSHFNHCSVKSKLGEFATVYLYCPEAAQRIYTHAPHVKLIAAIRHPAERAFSHYLMLRYFQHIEKRPFSQLIREEAEIIDKSKYGEQLQRYYKLFPKEQIMVIQQEALKSHPEQTTKALYQFLEVDPNFIPPNTTSSVNAARSIRSIRIAKLYGKVYEWLIDRGLSPLIHGLRKTGIKKLYDRWNMSKIEDLPELSQADRAYIMSVCQEDVALLEDLLGEKMNWV